MIVQPNGTLAISLLGRLFDRPSAQRWINPKTGSKAYCVDNPDATVMLSLDAATLDLQSQKTIENVRVVSMRQEQGRLYAAIGFNKNCSLDANAGLVEISREFELRTIFETTSINALDVTDLAITPKHFVLVGRLHTFLPTSSTRESASVEKLTDNIWNDFFWENNEDLLSAFVVVVAKNGTFFSDRVLSGVAHQAISSLGAAESGTFVGVGETFSTRGWVVAFSLQQAGGDTRDRIASWLKRIWANFAGNR